MKKFILLSISLIITLTVFSQSFLILNASKEDVSNDSFHVSGEINTTIKAQLYIVNNTGDALFFKVAKVETNVLGGTENTFCFNNQCYPPDAHETIGALSLLAGDTSAADAFYGQYTPNDIVGTSIITYYIINANDSTDYTTVEVTYLAEDLTFVPHLFQEAHLSNPYPNPATTQTKFNYNFPFNFNNAKLQIRNVIGATVKEAVITDNKGEIVIELDDLNDGIYIYTLVIDNRILLTRKLIKN